MGVFGAAVSATNHQTFPSAQTGGCLQPALGEALTTHCDGGRHSTTGPPVLGPERRFTQPPPVFNRITAGWLQGSSAT